MEITWYGHSCFLLESSDGTRILTDPCAPTTGYKLHDIACDVITSSHAHYDHNYFVAAAEPVRVISSEGEFEQGSVKISSFKTYHDDKQGAERGENLVFCFDIDGMRVVHLGDLGEPVSDELVRKLGPVDVLMDPVGGVYTFDAEEAMQTASILQAKIMIPMHYKTDALTFELGSVDDALTKARTSDIQRLNGTTCTMTPETIAGKKRILVFEYATC